MSSEFWGIPFLDSESSKKFLFCHHFFIYLVEIAPILTCDTSIDQNGTLTENFIEV